MEDSLNDELTSINSIYGDGTLVQTTPNSRTCTLKLPSYSAATLRIEFAENYPEVPPSILGTESVANDAPKGTGTRLVELTREVLGRVYQPGEACLYDLIEEIGPLLAETEQIDASERQKEADIVEQPSINQPVDIGPEPPWIVAPPITEKKSVFLGRVAMVHSPAQAKQYLQHLLATDKKASKATHNIVAWRIHGDAGASFQDCDDDGETAAGGRILHLMQLMDVWDVMVVVTRWYGGILLGPDRFRVINNAARDALQLGGCAKDGGKKGRR
ncbi:UPF0029-domain-containing protein [Microthyrium microscopicum]|uniref:UPF0029-domain-containing protein n=1 Tax=Microthyrium microscopicum TaxID=703497 RepID=A0A6A6UQ31_9PEZI|nr:UPF0029-domain-containing protein [Microthyrium microscopicum]